ncbi:hypothetical protein GJAV_G00171510 [Gymnothorax javanicus]|nr:hypothetical protein GJAV_G00171510 [Gymnothorax javanicus]
MERFLILTLLSGIQAEHLWGPMEVRGRERDSLSLCCVYDEDYIRDAKYWCRGSSFRFCRSVVSTSYPEHERTSLRENKKKRRFCITMKDLKVEDSGSYWCAITQRWIDESFQVKINIDAERPVTQSKPSTHTPTSVTQPQFTTKSKINENGSKPSRRPSTLSILGVSCGLLLFLLWLGFVMATIQRRRASLITGEVDVESKRDHLKSFADTMEVHYSEVTVGKKTKPVYDVTAYDNLYFHTTAEDRTLGGSVEYAAIKR